MADNKRTMRTDNEGTTMTDNSGTTTSDVKVQFSPVLPHIFPNPEPDLRVQFRPPLKL